MRILLTTLALSIALISSAEAGRKSPAVPEFSAKSYLVADSNGVVLKEHDTDAIMPIASISKLMIGFISARQDLDEHLSVPKFRLVHSSIPTQVTSLTRRELLTLALVKSDNLAAQVLCDNVPYCIDEMNSWANAFGMFNTKFVEPTGLSSENVSTANDLLKLMQQAIHIPVLTEITRMPVAEIPVEKKSFKVNNTNPLTSKLDIILSKTGYTTPAGGCLVMMINSSVGQRILILLGSKNAKTRIPDMERLVKELD